MSLDPHAILARSEIGRVSELNYVARFNQNYGFEDGVFEFLLSQKELWAERLFYVPENELLEWISSKKHPVREVPSISLNLYISAYKLNIMSEEEFRLQFGGTENIDLTITKSGIQAKQHLSAGQSYSLKTELGREGLVLNVGGRVTALKWSPYTSRPYLAVSVIGGPEELKDVVSHPELSVFPGKPSSGVKIRSAIQLWEYDPIENTLELRRVLETSAFGATSEIRWVPAKFDLDVIGVLAGVFTDGSLQFFEIKTNEMTTIYEQVTVSSYAIQSTTKRLNVNGRVDPITSFDFIDHKCVVVGTFNGSLAEYIIPSPQENDPLADVPSFLQYVAESAIKSVTIGRVGPNHIIFSQSMGNQSYTLHYENLRMGRVQTDYTNSLTTPTFHDNLRVFVYPDSAESFSLSFARHPQLKGTLIMRTELISSFHTSEYLGHPFAIIGNTLGQVFLVNISRRIFALPKGQQKFVNPLKIWSLYKTSSSDELILNGDYEQIASDRSSIVYTFTPPEVVVSATAWNENINGSSSYAFGTHSGLLVVEKLDSH